MAYIDFYGSNGDDQMVLVADKLGDIQRYYGLAGNDTFYATTGHGADTIDGGDGIDTLIVDYSANTYKGVYPSGIKMNGGIFAWREPSPTGAYADSVHFTNIERFYIIGTYANDSLSGLDYGDTLIGGVGNDIINGNAGNNTLDGGDGKDTIYAGNHYGNGNDFIDGGSGDDIIYADWIGIANRGNDTVNAGSGNDTIFAGDGIDVIDGGEGIDVVKEVNLSAATTGLVFNDTGATQADVSLSNGAKLVDVEYVDELTTGSGNDIITYTSSRNQKVKTGAGNDIITIGIGSDEVDGGDGSDLLKVDYSANTYTGTKAGLRINAVWDYGDYSGGFYAYNSSSSYDRGSFSNIERFDIKGTNTADEILTGEFDDQVAGNIGNDFIDGRSGNDLLDGGEGDDTIRGGAGIDSITGSSGNDLLIGQDGNDILTGGRGVDQFGFNGTVNPKWIGVDAIEDFVAGTDKIVLHPMTFGLATGALPEQMFATIGSDADAARSSALVVYNTTTGGLFYNQNGSADGFGTGAQFANLTNQSTLTAADFVVQYI